MKTNTEDLTVQGSKDRDIILIFMFRKVGRKRKGVQERRQIDKQCEININTVAEELVSSENIASEVWVPQQDRF